MPIHFNKIPIGLLSVMSPQTSNRVFCSSRGERGASTITSNMNMQWAASKDTYLIWLKRDLFTKKGWELIHNWWSSLQLFRLWFPLHYPPWKRIPEKSAPFIASKSDSSCTTSTTTFCKCKSMLLPAYSAVHSPILSNSPSTDGDLHAQWAANWTGRFLELLPAVTVGWCGDAKRCCCAVSGAGTGASGQHSLCIFLGRRASLFSYLYLKCYALDCPSASLHLAFGGASFIRWSFNWNWRKFVSICARSFAKVCRCWGQENWPFFGANFFAFSRIVYGQTTGVIRTLLMNVLNRIILQLLPHS